MSPHSSPVREDQDRTRETAEIEPKSYVITQSLGVNRIMELREQKFLSRAKNIIAKLKMNFEKTWQFRNARWMFKLAAFRGKWNFWCQSKLGKPCVFTEMVQNVMLKYIFCTWSFNYYPSFIYRMNAYIQKGVINEKTWFKKCTLPLAIFLHPTTFHQIYFQRKQLIAVSMNNVLRLNQ